MGMFSTAELVFGIDIGEDFPFPRPSSVSEDDFYDQGSDGKFYDFIVADAGYSSDEESEAKTEFLKQFPLCLCATSNPAYPTYFVLAIEACSFASATQNSPTAVDLDKLVVDPGHLEFLREFAKKHGVAGEPSWLLLSDYS